MNGKFQKYKISFKKLFKLVWMNSEKKTSLRIASNYQSEYLTKTEELQNNLNQEELLIDAKNNQIIMDLFQKVKKIVQDKDHNLQKLYQKELEVQSQKLGKIHLVALREKKEQDKIDSLQNFQEEVKQVKAQNNELEKEIKTSKEIQKKLLSSVGSRVPQEGVMEKGLLNQGEKVTGPSSVKTSQSEGIGALIMVATPILAVLGTVSYFFFQTL
jgi:phenylalanyl-tRNA synthetase alpha subunit